MDLHDITVIRAILKKHNLWAKKYLGQNFLINKDVLDKIVETAGLQKTDQIIEIGPGLGILTQELAQKTARVITIELDQNLVPILKENLKEYKNITILNQDALQFSPQLKNYKVVANIPYNITSPLINLFLQTENKPTSITLLVQKEVAEKICTLEPDMTVLSLQITLFGQAKLIKHIGAESFYPIPKVDSTILQITLYQPNNPNYIATDKALQILKLAKQAFSQRRKKLSNTLSEYKAAMQHAGIDANRRPETLSVKEWLTLQSACALAEIRRGQA